MSLIALLFALAVPATAGATSAAGNAYSEAAPLNEVNEAGNNASASAPAATAETGSSSVLPFTGLDLVIVLLLGVSLLGVGMLIRRANRTTGT